MIKHFFSYKWDLLGKHAGLNIIRRLDWINGKVLVRVALLNILLWIINTWGRNISEINTIITLSWWKVVCMIVNILFWILFIDGVIVKFLWTFTDGKYCTSYFYKKFKYKFDNSYLREKIREDLSWGCLLFTHPEFANARKCMRNQMNSEIVHVQERVDRGAVRWSGHYIYAGKYDNEAWDALNKAYESRWQKLYEEHQIYKSENGKWYCTLDKDRTVGRKIGIRVAYMLCFLTVFWHIGIAVLAVNAVDYGVDYIGEKAEDVVYEKEMFDEDLDEMKDDESASEKENLVLGQNVNEPVEPVGHEVLKCKGSVVEVTVDVARLYVLPTDYSHMYEANHGMKFVATGNEYVDEVGIYWYELYIDERQSQTAWIKIEEMLFLE